MKDRRKRLGKPVDLGNKVLHNTPLNDKKPTPRLPRNKKLPNKKGKSNVSSNSSDSKSGSQRNNSHSSSSSRSRSTVTPPKNVEQKARRLTNGIIRGEVKDLRAQRREVNRAADNANALTETQYTRGVGDLTAVRDETTEFINRMNTQNQSMFDSTKLQETAAAAALQNQLGQTYDQAQAGVSSELGALGIDNGQFATQLNDDQASAQSLGAVNSAASQSNLSLANQNSSQLGSLLGGMAQGSFISNLGQNLNTRNDSLATTGQERIDQQALVREAIQDAKGSRKDVFFELLNQLQQSGWTPKSSSSSRSSSRGPSNGGDRDSSSSKNRTQRGAQGALKGKTAMALGPRELKSFNKTGKTQAKALGERDLKQFNKKNK